MSNPYTSSDAADLAMVDGDYALASLGARFGAKVIDWIAGVASLMPGVLLVGLVGPENLEGDDVAAGLIGLLVVGCLMAVTVFQWFLITTRGQTIGKSALGIRIVRMDGRPLDFVTGVVLRLWIMGFVTGIANQLCLGWIVFLVDVLPIFGDERRCLHDQIAGTRVVEGGGAATG